MYYRIGGSRGRYDFIWEKGITLGGGGNLLSISRVSRWRVGDKPRHEPDISALRTGKP